MNKNVIDNILEKVIGIGIYALFIVPFLIPYSYFPVSKFYSEMMTLVIALAIATLAIYKSKQLNISSAGIACFAFVLFLFLQVLVLPIRFPGINTAIAIEFAIAGLLSVGITSLVNSDEEIQKKLITQVAWAALIGVTIQAIYGFLQYTGQAENFKSFILTTGTSDILGNIGQKNDYADFISIGIFALAYLYFIRQINLAVFAVYAVFFGFIITINTSRTSFVYFILALIFAIMFTFKNRNNSEFKIDNKRALILLVSMFVGLVILEALIPKLASAFAASSSSGGETSGLYRLDELSTIHRRVYEWYKDIIIFIQHPILGIGWYQYPREAIYLMNTDRFMYIPTNTKLYTHSHNSPLNLLAETGIIGFGITMIYGFGYSLFRMFKNFNNYATLFLSFMILTIFGQSCFQYPLWYAYFLMFFVMFLSFDKPILSIANNKAIKAAITLIFIGFLGFFYINNQTYNQLVSYTAVPDDADDFAHNAQQIQQIVDNNSLWSLSALMVLDNYILPTSPKTNAAMSMQDQLKYIDKLGNELPYAGAIFKQIIIHRVVGDSVGALAYANLLAHAFPALKDQFAQQLQSSPAFNEEVSAIYNFKYEDKSIFAKKN